MTAILAALQAIPYPQLRKYVTTRNEKAPEGASADPTTPCCVISDDRCPSAGVLPPY